MDAERIVADHLNEDDAVTATCYYDVPAARPKSFIVIERTGGPRTERAMERPLMDAQCWADGRRNAAVLADAVIASVERMPGECPEVFHVNITSTYRDYDLESGTPRFHVVFEMTLS